MNLARTLGTASMVAVLSWALAACGSSQAVTESSLGALSRSHYPTLVMVEPVFTFEHQPADVYLRAHQLIRELVGRHGIPVVAPWEAGVAEEDEWPHGEQLLTDILVANGLDASRVLLLEFVVREDGPMRTVQIPSSFGGGLTTVYEPDVSVELVVRTLYGGRLLASSSYRFEENVYATSSDPLDMETRPMLRDAIHLAAQGLAMEFELAFPMGAAGNACQPAGVYNASQIFSYGGGAGLTLTEGWIDEDPFEIRMDQIDWYKRVEPGLTTGQIRFFESNGPGVLLTTSEGGLGDSGIGSGDFVVGVDGEPALGVHTIERACLLTPAGETLRLDILRDGVEERVYVDR